MASISAIQKGRLEIKLSKIEEDMKINDEKLNIARSYGDASENSELDAALQERANLQIMRSDILSVLQNSEVIEDDESPLIGVGSLVKVVNQDDGMETIYLIDEHGDTLIDGVLSTSSPLGIAVLGKPSGNFTIQSPQGKSISFIVTKLDKSFVDKFCRDHPDSDSFLDAVFGGI